MDSQDGYSLSTLKYAPIVEAKSISKDYGEVKALSNLDLNVVPGEIYGLLGPNGAGKSTLIKIIAGLVAPTSGSIRVMGQDPSIDPLGVKSRIGYVSENSTLYDSLTPRDFFEFISSIRKTDPRLASERIKALAPVFGLDQFYDSPIATLSMGTKQKISLIAALLHEPPLLLLDEPLNGLDARSSRIVKDIISLHAKKTGGAVLFSTHIMEVAEHVCDRIGIIYQGKIVAEGSLDELRGKAKEIAVSSGRDQETIGPATLEEVFLKLTHEEEEIQETIRTLREAFFVGK
ncbi:MAG TPA: ABC transporter ATP-binding protein [Nitrososphaerales archaeon]|nr:ABC transporter ATP-binding protein [Nitrososphaerales archaeon]